MWRRRSSSPPRWPRLAALLLDRVAGLLAAPSNSFFGNAGSRRTSAASRSTPGGSRGRSRTRRRWPQPQVAYRAFTGRARPPALPERCCRAAHQHVGRHVRDGRLPGDFSSPTGAWRLPTPSRRASSSAAARASCRGQFRALRPGLDVGRRRIERLARGDGRGALVVPSIAATSGGGGTGAVGLRGRAGTCRSSGSRASGTPRRLHVVDRTPVGGRGGGRRAASRPGAIVLGEQQSMRDRRASARCSSGSPARASTSSRSPASRRPPRRSIAGAGGVGRLVRADLRVEHDEARIVERHSRRRRTLSSSRRAPCRAGPRASVRISERRDRGASGSAPEGVWYARADGLGVADARGASPSARRPAPARAV